MAAIPLEQRVAALEAEMARAKARLERQGGPMIPWWKQIKGAFANDPAFEEAGARTLVQQVSAYERLSRHLDLYRRIRVLEFDERAATEFQRLRQARIRVGTMDLKIAAVVLAHDATLLSRNLRDFHKVPGLSVEDWTV